MSSDYHYYQLGGHRPEIQWFKSSFDEKQLAEAIASPSSPLKGIDGAFEVILGITPWGSSHLLLTVDQTRRLSSRDIPYPRNRPCPQSKFESLSPIFFASADELAKKLKALKPTGKKSFEDSSKANKGYRPTELNVARGAFEHGRVFYRILGDVINPNAFGVASTSWKECIGICSFVFNTKGVDDRPAAERLRTPHVLEMGFCRASLDLKPAYTSSRYIIPSGNTLLGRQGTRQTFKYGKPESVSTMALPQIIQELFQGCKSPTVLLVNNVEETINYIRNLGVQTSEWKIGLKELLYPKTPTSSSDLQTNGYDYRREYNRSRSRSPSRHSRQDSTRYASSSRYSNTPQHSSRRPTYAPVYVVDVQHAYITLMQSPNTKVKTVADIALQLQLPTEKGWCAGNEAPLLIDIWRSMVSGVPIDEQRDMRMAGAPSSEAQADPTPGPSSLQPGSEPDEDSEEDPNISMTYAQTSKQQFVNPPQTHKTGNLDLDDSDYGDSDSEASD